MSVRAWLPKTAAKSSEYKQQPKRLPLIRLGASAAGSHIRPFVRRAAHIDPDVLGHRFDHLAVEGWNVGEVATADQIAVFHYFLIDPVASFIADVFLQRRLTGQKTTLDQPGRNKQR